MILAYLEHKEGSLKKNACEVLSQAKKLSEKLSVRVTALIIGKGVKNLAKETSQYGPSKVLVADNENLVNYNPEIFGNIIAKTAVDLKATYLIMSATSLGRDIAPKLAARLRCSLINDCINIETSNGSIVFTRPVYAGRIIAKLNSATTPVVVTLRQNVFPVNKNEAKDIPVEDINIDINSIELKTKIVEVVASVEETIELTEADIIVSGGRGIGSSGNYKLIKDLAKVLGAATGASRAVVDAGWVPHEFQVGQTGKTVSPSLYIACGISGAIQHLAGMSSSKCVVAINKDPEAPIFKVADYGIVANLSEAIPILIEEIKKLRA